MKWNVLVGAFVAIASAVAQAQVTYHVASSKVIEGSWRWAAIYSEDGADRQVHSLLAILNPSAKVGDNLQQVWYIRGTPWTSQTWTDPDPWVAINFIKSELGIPDSEDANWEVCTSSGTTQMAAPVGYARGVVATDPMALALASSPNRNQLIQQLVAMGHPAANITLDSTDDCTTDQQLEGLASNFEGMIGNGDDAVADAGEGGINCQTMVAMPWGPRPTRPAKPVPPPWPPAWTPPGTVPGSPGPTWTPGGWPTAPAWSCRFVPTSGGGGSCICSRGQYWGRWETTTCGCWPITWACVRWHEAWETETCTELNVPCPAGGPPGPLANCNTTTRY